MYSSTVICVMLKLASITAFIPFADAQSDGNLVCENIWIGTRTVKLTFALQKFDFNTKCPGGTDGISLFQHSTDGSLNPYITKCTAPDIRTSACNYQSGTNGCGCVGENSTSYIIEYNLTPDSSFNGYWRPLLTCFDNTGGSPLKFTHPTCDGIPEEWNCEPLDMDETVDCTNGFKNGSVCTRKCESGLYTVPPSPVICQEFGVWSGTLGSCEIELNCEPLDMDETVNCTNGFKNGSVCTRKCESGLKTIPPSPVTCQELGVWSGTLGSCKIAPGPAVGIACVVAAIIAIIIVLIYFCCCCCVDLRKCSCRCCHDLVLHTDPKGKYKDNPSGLEGIRQSLRGEADAPHSGINLQRIGQEARMFPCCGVKVGFVNTSTGHEMTVIRNSAPNSTSTEASAFMEVYVSSSNTPNVKKAAKEVKKVINKLNPGSYDIV